MTHEIPTPSTTYQFTIYPADTQFNRIAGIYIFLILPPVAEALEPVAEALESAAEVLEATSPQKDTQHPAPIIQQYSLLYIGITNNFRGRFNQHHKVEQAISLGMTHIGILKITSGRKRKKIEREILKTYNPPLNQTWLS